MGCFNGPESASILLASEKFEDCNGILKLQLQRNLRIATDSDKLPSQSPTSKAPMNSLHFSLELGNFPRDSSSFSKEV